MELIAIVARQPGGTGEGTPRAGLENAKDGGEGECVLILVKQGSATLEPERVEQLAVNDGQDVDEESTEALLGDASRGQGHEQCRTHREGLELLVECVQPDTTQPGPCRTGDGALDEQMGVRLERVRASAAAELVRVVVGTSPACSISS